LGVSSKKLESVIYYERYVIIQPGRAAEGVNVMTEKGEEHKKLAYLDLLSEEEYLSVLKTKTLKNNYMLKILTLINL
jgi:DNA-directed RNA polymerase subunit beta'